VSGLEQAIRNALERAERSNPEIRSRIYQSARNALDTGLRKQDINDPIVIERQRQRLEVTIRAIEEEERERLRMAARLEKVFIESAPFEPEAAETEPVVEAREVKAEPIQARIEPIQARVEPIQARVEPAMAPPRPVAEPEILPPQPESAEAIDGSLSDLSVTRDERPAPLGGGKAGKPARSARDRQRILHEEEDPAWAEPSTPEGRVLKPERRAAQRRRGSWVVSLFVYCVLLGVIGFGAWWVYATGMVDAALHGTGNFDLIPKELQSEDFDPKAGEKNPLDPLRGFSGEWVNIFKPGEPDRIKPSSSARIGEVADSDGKAITIASNAPDQDGEVRIEVPAAILQDLAGKTSTLALTLRADGDTPSQIYVQCEFTTLGDCGRHRFTVSNERIDELIQVKFNGKLGPSDPGYVVINSDLSGEGKAIRLYGIRVLPGS
jgi:hypothetical protein